MTAIHINNPLSNEDRENVALAISDEVLVTLVRTMEDFNEGRGPKPGDTIKIIFDFRIV